MSDSTTARAMTTSGSKVTIGSPPPHDETAREDNAQSARVSKATEYESDSEMSSLATTADEEELTDDEALELIRAVAKKRKRDGHGGVNVPLTAADSQALNINLMSKRFPTRTDLLTIGIDRSERMDTSNYRPPTQPTREEYGAAEKDEDVSSPRDCCAQPSQLRSGAEQASDPRQAPTPQLEDSSSLQIAAPIEAMYEPETDTDQSQPGVPVNSSDTSEQDSQPGVNEQAVEQGQRIVPGSMPREGGRSAAAALQRALQNGTFPGGGDDAMQAKNPTASEKKTHGDGEGPLGTKNASASEKESQADPERTPHPSGGFGL